LHISTPSIEPADSLTVNAARFRRHLRASGLSPKTEQTYLEGVANLTAFLVERGMPTELGSIAREHLEAWLRDARNRPQADDPGRPLPLGPAVLQMGPRRGFAHALADGGDAPAQDPRGAAVGHSRRAIGQAAPTR
jgi:hypothetical protein